MGPEQRHFEQAPADAFRAIPLRRVRDGEVVVGQVFVAVDADGPRVTVVQHGTWSEASGWRMDSSSSAEAVSPVSGEPQEIAAGALVPA